jgi:hypothetical protein
MGNPPRIDVVFYAEGGKCPSLEWLVEQPHKVQDKFDFLIALLEDKGSTLQRPYAAPLGRKIYELRARWQNVNYRLLYFFNAGTVAIIAHGCTKEDVVEPADIDRAVARRDKYLRSPASHTYSEVG